MSLDESTRSALGRIDDALAWEPGVPLHERSAHARPIYEVLDDMYFVWARCTSCEVSWVGPDPCWSCGKRPAAERTLSGDNDLAITANVSAFDAAVWRALRAQETIVEVVSGHAAAAVRLLDAVGDAAIADELVRLTLGGRGPDRPELVDEPTPLVDGHLWDAAITNSDHAHWTWAAP